MAAILAKSIETLHLFTKKWSLPSPPPPYLQHNVDVGLSTQAQDAKTSFFGGGEKGSENEIKTSHFKIMYH